MTLLTPPHTRLDKENRRAGRPISARVSWSQSNEYHSLTSPPCTRKLATSVPKPKERPLRSILKQTSYPILPLLFPENDEREVTPEPSSPLSDLHFLDGPVNRILAPCSSLVDLIEAYSVLTARLRAAVQESTDSDCSWPLFQPLRKRRIAFVDAVVRDLGRALVDPMEGSDQSGCPVPEPPSVLPSPEKSPRKKRCGMDEEQVKYARDLATVSHAVIKLLGLVFTLPAVYSLFDGSFRQFSLSFFFPIDLALWQTKTSAPWLHRRLRSLCHPSCRRQMRERHVRWPSGFCRRSDCPRTFWHQRRTELRMLFDARWRASSEKRVRKGQ